MRQEIIAVAIAFIATRDIGVDAYFSQVLTRSKPAILFGHKETIDRINSQWCPHMVLGDAKIEEFALIKQQQDDEKNAEIAKKEALLAAESAKLAADVMAKKEAEAKAVAAAAAASAAESAKAAAIASAKKEEEAKAVAAAAAASAAESAKAAAVALAKKEEEELEEAAELAMAVAAAAAKKDAADAEAAIRIKKQEELSRLAEVASKANAIEKAESEKSTATATASSSPTNPIQLQDMLLTKKKTVSEQLLSADGVSAPVSDDVDIFDIMQASAEAEAAQVCVGNMAPNIYIFIVTWS